MISEIIARLDALSEVHGYVPFRLEEQDAKAFQQMVWHKGAGKVGSAVAELYSYALNSNLIGDDDVDEVERRMAKRFPAIVFKLDGEEVCALSVDAARTVSLVAATFEDRAARGWNASLYGALIDLGNEASLLQRKSLRVYA